MNEQVRAQVKTMYIPVVDDSFYTRNDKAAVRRSKKMKHKYKYKDRMHG